MKNILKILLIVTIVFGFYSCTSDDEVVIENKIINLQEIDNGEVI